MMVRVPFKYTEPGGWMTGFSNVAHLEVTCQGIFTNDSMAPLHGLSPAIKSISKMAANFFYVDFSLTFLTYLMLFELFFGSNFYNFMT